MTRPEDIFKCHGQLPESVRAIANEGRTVHGGQRFRAERRQSVKRGIRLSGVGHVIGQRALLILHEDLPAAVKDIRVRDRLNVAVLVKQV